MLPCDSTPTPTQNPFPNPPLPPPCPGFTSKNRNYFGELALLYDAPRAATVTAAGVVVCWGLDRVTFKQILQDSTQKQRHLYKKFLEQVPVLGPLSVYERLTIADALSPQNFAEGDKIIEEGSEGYEFFIVERGSVICTKLVDGVSKTVSESLGPGDYFGELSLINNEDRAATVTAQEDTTCLTIDRKTFKRLLGPLEGMLREHQELYAKYVEDAKEGD
jgi:cAMP-dependent protein kinase regulator